MSTVGPEGAVKEILTSAEAALRKARSDAQAVQQQVEREHESLLRLELEREGLKQSVEDLDRALTDSLTAHAQTQQTLDRLTAEHRAVLEKHAQLDVLLNEERDRARLQSDATATLERKRFEQQLAARQQLEASKAQQSRTEADRAALQARVEALEGELSSTRDRLEAEAAAYETAQRSRSAELASAETRLTQLLSRAASLEAAFTQTRQQLATTGDALKAAEAEVARTQPFAEALSHTRQQLTTAQAGLEAADVDRLQLTARMKRLEPALAETGEQLAASRQGFDALSREHARALKRVGLLENERAASESALAELTAKHAIERDRAEAASALLSAERQRVKALEGRIELKLTLEEEKAPLVLPSTGKGLDPKELARLMMRLVRGRADVRLELSAGEGTRWLWLEQGKLVGAQSSVRIETLFDRARRDGLIDSRQEAALRGDAEVFPAQQLAELLTRGLVRQAEVAGLVRRYAEQVALEAFTESECAYRLQPEPPQSELPKVDAARPLALLLALGLRRAFSWEAHLELLGGTRAVPRHNGRLDARPYGFSDGERSLLESIDGARDVEALVTASRLRPEGAYCVLSAAKLLGLLELSPPPPRASTQPPLQLLDEKFGQLQQADYFVLLGLPRSAGSTEVQRAHRRLFEQLEPLRQDPSAQHRARVVLTALEEAARTLEDDRLRAAYARALRP